MQISKDTIDILKNFSEINQNLLVKEGNTLVLVDRIKAGEMLQERLGDESVFISGSVKSAERREQYNEVQDSNNKVIIANTIFFSDFMFILNDK